MEKNLFSEVCSMLRTVNEFIRKAPGDLSQDDLKNIECLCSVVATTARTRAFFASLSMTVDEEE